LGTITFHPPSPTQHTPFCSLSYELMAITAYIFGLQWLLLMHSFISCFSLFRKRKTRKQEKRKISVGWKALPSLPWNRSKDLTTPTFRAMQVSNLSSPDHDLQTVLDVTLKNVFHNWFIFCYFLMLVHGQVLIRFFVQCRPKGNHEES
jgi:hypothetical protein